MQDDLTHLRKHIDQLDEQLARLLNDRARTALRLGKIKANMGIELYDPSRERVVLDRIDTLNKGPLSKGAMEDIFADIITACREIQLEPKRS